MAGDQRSPLSAVFGLQTGQGPAGPKKALNQLDVRGPGPLVVGFGVVSDLCAVGERAIALADDRAVMDEQVLGLVIRCDEAKSLVVAEPLDGSGSHCVPPASIVLRTRRLLSKSYDRWHRDVGRIARPDLTTVAAPKISARLAPGVASLTARRHAPDPAVS